MTYRHQENSSYQDFQAEDGWTDAQYDAMVRTLRGEVAARPAPPYKRPATLGEWTAARTAVDFETLLGGWRKGDKQGVAMVFAVLGDVTITSKFCLCLAKHCGPQEADRFADLVGSLDEQMAPTHHAARACIDWLATLYAEGDHAPTCSGRAKGRCDCGRAMIAEALQEAGEGI